MSDQVESVNTKVEILDTDFEVSCAADIVELYREYAFDELNKNNEDFLLFSDWKELNKEALL